MKFLILFFLFLNSFNLRAEDVFKSITVNTDKTPYLLQLMLTHLQSEIIDIKDSQEILKGLIELEENLRGLSLVDQKFFVVSEVHKSILNFKFKVKTTTDTLSSFEIKALPKKLNDNKVVYSPFSQFIIQSTYLDFEAYLEKDYFDNYQTLKNIRNRSFKKANQLRKALKYSGQWVNNINSHLPNKFNQLVTQVIKNFVKNASIQSKVFFIHSPKLKEANPVFSGLGDIKIKSFLSLNPAEVDQTPPDLEVERKAFDAVKSLKIDPIDKAREDIDKLFENNDL